MAKKPKLRPDVAEVAYRTMREAVGEAPKTDPELPNAEAARRGARGGRKGGKARAKSLTAAERSDIARRAAAARWSK